MASHLGEEVFWCPSYGFNVTKAKRILALKPRPASDIDVAALIPGSVGVRIDREHAMTTDLSEPIILVQVEDPKTGDWLRILIDGHHRLYRAAREGVARLPAYLLTPNESLAVRVS